jgi:hypothetical protein
MRSKNRAYRKEHTTVIFLMMNAQAQRALVARLTLRVPRRWPKQGQPA